MIRTPEAPVTKAAAATLSMIVVLAVAWAGRASEGEKALADSDSALAQGTVDETIVAAQVAAEARCPGCTAPDQGLTRLARIAKDAEARGDDATAFAAWSATRAALLATSTATGPAERRVHAESEIARFGHRIDAAAIASGAATPTASEASLRASLARAELPTGATFALVGAGGLVFAIAALRFAISRKNVGLEVLAIAAAGAALATAGALFF